MLAKQTFWCLNKALITLSILQNIFGDHPATLTGTANTTHTSQRLVIDVASPAHMGWYQCRATDGNDAARCRGLNVLYPCVRTDVLSDSAWIQVIGMHIMS